MDNTSARPVTATRGRTFAATFSSLRHRNYRLLWSGTIISHSGDWMDQIAFNWLVYQMTESAAYLGLVNLCRMAPILVFTLIAGVVADRVERRRLLFTTQAVAMLLALVLAILVTTNLVQIWMVFAVAIGRGVMMSFNQPARQTLISDLVPPEDLMNAIALNSATNNLTRVIGPALGGVLIATIGVAGAFYVNAASFVAVLLGLALMRFPERTQKVRQGVVTELLGGVRYLRSQPALRTLVVLALIPYVLGLPYVTMLTVFAKDVLDVGASGLGLLTSCTGLGAVIGALMVASRPSGGSRGLYMLMGLVSFGLTLTVFSFSPWLWLSLICLIAVGVSQQSYFAVNNTLIQEYAHAEYRGRVVSTLFLNRGLIPLGTMLAGFGTEAFGVQTMTAIMAVTLVLLALTALRFAPEVRYLA